MNDGREGIDRVAVKEDIHLYEVGLLLTGLLIVVFVAATLAALLFGFATSVAQTLPVIGSSVSPDIISMIPYIVTILAVAGFVGKVRAPAAEGVPYP